MTEKGVIFGFGRMGITHLALLNQYSANCFEWTIVEPGFFPRLLGRLLFVGSRLKFRKRLPRDFKADLAVISSPVSFHEANFLELHADTAKVFVEKPLSISAEHLEGKSNVLPGYVLRHNEMAKLFKWALDSHEIRSLNIELLANTATTDSKGWRFQQGSGVVEEFGCHVLNLGLFLIGDSLELDSSEVKSLVTQVPDRFTARFTNHNADILISADWCTEGVRKPTYSISAELADGGRISTDLYRFEHAGANGELISESSLADSGASSQYYLRGFEFSEQARFLVNTNDFAVELRHALRTDQLIEEIVNGNNPRR